MAATTPARWTRPAELLVYLVPVGTISPELYAGYVRLLQAHSVQPVRSLTRPGGYAPELSPFKSFAWDGAAALRLRFVSTTDRVDAADGEDVHASARAVAVLGLCHCPTTRDLAAAYASFESSLRHFPGLLVHKVFAFEHQFDLQSVDACAARPHLVMFPVYHELGADVSTVSLHLGVVLDTLCVTLLMSIESAVRAALRQQSHEPSNAVDAANFLLDTNVEPSQLNANSSTSQPLSPFRDGAASPASAAAVPSASAGGVAALFGGGEGRLRRRHAARLRKLVADYAVLLGCLPDAVDHYVAAIELLREEDRRGGATAPGDALWLAAALEGYAFCLYSASQDRFVVEIVDKASEAVALYARAGTAELELALVQHVGWYYAAVAGRAPADEALWTKRLLGEALERGLAVLPDVPAPRQVQFLVHAAGMLECVGHHRRMALYLHEAAALLLRRWSSSSSVASPTSAPLPHQRTQDLRAALQLEQITAARLGMEGRTRWEPTSLRQRRLLPHRRRGGALPRVTLADSAAAVEPWLVLRFHVLRQLLSLAQALGDAFLVGTNCVRLLHVLAWCDSVASSSSAPSSASSSASASVDQLQLPLTLALPRSAPLRQGLHARAASVYASPPLSLEPKTKRYFAASSAAAAALSSTIANTPRALLATPRQQLSAAVSAISTKASPAFGSFTSHSPGGGGGGGSTTPRSASAELPNHADPATKPAAQTAAELVSPSAAASAEASSLPSAPWDLRSRPELLRLQRSVLRLLETECAVLRPSEQLQLDAFVRVHRVRVAYDAQRHPLAAPLPCSSSSAVLSSSTASSAPPAFFYNPFDAKSATENRKSESDSDSDEELKQEEEEQRRGEEEEGTNWAKSFPANERVLIYVTLSNPLGVALDIQQVTAAFSSPSSSSPAPVESYPTSTTLQPYEQRRTLVLSVRPLAPGRLLLLGCVVKAVNVKTSFRLATPRPLAVVPSAPRLRCDVRELGGLHEETALACVPSSSSPSSSICMFANETKRCVLTLRNDGHHALHSLRIRLRVGRGTERTLFDSATGEGAAEAEGMAFTCMVGAAELAERLPLLRGERIELPFRVVLRSGSSSSPPLMEEQLRWSFGYSGDAAAYCRESTHSVTLVPLPSLAVQRVVVESIGGGGVGERSDHPSCRVTLDVVNPTETVFLLHLRRRGGAQEEDGDQEEEWDVEVGRQSVRSLVVELPRVEHSGAVAELLSSMVALQWGTYFGARGALLLPDSLWSSSSSSSAQRSAVRRQLMRSDVSMTVQPLDGFVEREPEEGTESRGGERFPFRFFHPATRVQRRDKWIARLLQPCTVALVVERRGRVAVHVDLVIQREDGGGQEEEDSDATGGEDPSVIVSGQTQRLLSSRGEEEEEEGSTSPWHVRLVFLSEGSYRVCVRARWSSRAADGASLEEQAKEEQEEEEEEVWHHSPLRVSCRA